MTFSSMPVVVLNLLSSIESNSRSCSIVLDDIGLGVAFGAAVVVVVAVGEAVWSD